MTDTFDPTDPENAPLDEEEQRAREKQDRHFRERREAEREKKGK